jgi:hypothetical protein
MKKLRIVVPNVIRFINDSFLFTKSKLKAPIKGIKNNAVSIFIFMFNAFKAILTSNLHPTTGWINFLYKT